MWAHLDGLKNWLRAKDEELGRKGLEMEGLARSLREVKAENRRLQAELDKGNEVRAEIDRLAAELAKEREHTAMLNAYYDSVEPQMEALRQRANKAEGKAKRLAHEAAEPTEAAKTSCRTLRLALTDMGAKAGGVPGRLHHRLLQLEPGGRLRGFGLRYGVRRLLCARVGRLALGLLQQNGCEHVARFPEFAKGDWEVSSQDVSPALRAWLRQFWLKEGRSVAKTRLLKQLAKSEAANQGEEPAAGGRGGAEDHPEGRCRKLCVRPPLGDWRSRNKKFIAVKNLPMVRYQLWPIYREMTINGNNYKVISVANWMRTHPRRTLEDFDRVRVARFERTARFWRNHRRTDRQEAIAQRRYALSVVSPPSPLRCIISVVTTNRVRQMTLLIVLLGVKM
uniref:Uncharacterized protein n=1 Tax=Oryza punctata TaxID=4537 RepID=A0A0E0LC24_ORYPU